jgi:Skp family chaperone for outer membrane proteins
MANSRGHGPGQTGALGFRGAHADGRPKFHGVPATAFGIGERAGSVEMRRTAAGCLPAGRFIARTDLYAWPSFLHNSARPEPGSSQEADAVPGYHAIVRQGVPSMKSPYIVAAVLVCGVGLLAATQLSAQRPAAPAAGPATGISLLNLSSILQNSGRLKKAMESWNTELDTRKAELKKESDLGNQLTEKVRSLAEGTPERKKLEQEVTKMRADYELHGKRARDEARDREAKILYSFLREMQDEVTRYASANGTRLILRYDPPPEDYSDPRAIYQEVTRPIVYQRAPDCTAPILEALNRRGGANTATRPAAPNRPIQK